MSTSARLDVSELTVVPGSPAQCQVLVANRGSIVEGYSLSVIGELAPFARVEPATLSLYPESEAVATVTIDVPRGAGISAGEVPFGVVVEPQEHPADVAVPEAIALVQSFSDVTAELTPRTSHGSRNGRHSLAVDNKGNEPVTLNLAGKDPDAAMDFRISPSTLEVPPNSAGFAKIKARPLERMWRGTPKTRQFSVTAALVTVKGVADPLHGPNQTVIAKVDGMMVQDPILPSWTGKAVVGALLAAAGIAGLWMFVMKQAIESTAKDALQKPMASISSKAVEAEKKADEADKKADEADNTSKTNTKDTKKTLDDQKKKEAAEAAAVAAAEGKGFGERYDVSAARGDSDEETYSVPKGQILKIYDTKFYANGGQGTLSLMREDSTVSAVDIAFIRNIWGEPYISPIEFTEGQKVRIKITCTQPPAGKTKCDNAIWIGGRQVDKPKPTPPPTQTPTPN